MQRTLGLIPSTDEGHQLQNSEGEAWLRRRFGSSYSWLHSELKVNRATSGKVGQIPTETCAGLASINVIHLDISGKKSTKETSASYWPVGQL